MLVKVSETKIKVRYVETDQMGIVHHSNYFVWFEVGRTEFIKESGIKYSDMEKMGVLLPLIESGCQYKTGARYEDEIIISTSVKLITPIRIEFKYEVIRVEDEKLLAVGFTKHVFVDKELKPINLRKKNAELWDSFNKFVVDLMENLV